MLYNPDQSYAENFTNGPQFNKPIPKRPIPPQDDWVDFLGFPVISPIGVPAGPLLNAEWTGLAAKLGYDIVTYKSIRTCSHPGHPLPNILHVKDSDDPGVKLVDLNPSSNPHKIAITNSFGMPSQSPEFLKKDIAKARSEISKGQVLVVSITGTPSENQDIENDYVTAALLAKKAGAMVIEANFSCPNVNSSEGSIYYSPATVYTLASNLVHHLESMPLIIKLGAFPNISLLRSVLIAAKKAGVKAVSGINTLSCKVVNENGFAALGKDRLTSGICGAPIRESALSFVRDARKIIDEEILPLKLIGVGGVTSPKDFDTFLNAGADFVQSATGMMWDPLLAHKWHLSKGLVYA